MTDRLTKLRQVARLVESAGEQAVEQMTLADRADQRGDVRGVEYHSGQAEAALLAVYAKIGTLRHNGPPEARAT